MADNIGGNTLHSFGRIADKRGILMNAQSTMNDSKLALKTKNGITYGLYLWRNRSSRNGYCWKSGREYA
eukprot:86484-Karenia_brevis.AAC.1